jgi:hypothetical protein
VLLAELARRHAVLAFKQVAHHSAAGEALFAGDLLYRLRVVVSWSAAWRRRSAVRYCTKLTPPLCETDVTARPRRQTRGRHLLQREAALIVGVDPRHHAGYSPAPFFGSARRLGDEGTAGSVASSSAISLSQRLASSR